MYTRRSWTPWGKISSRRRSRIILLTVYALAVTYFLRPFFWTEHAAPTRTSRLQYRASSFNWTGFQQHHLPGPLALLPSGKPKKFPRVQSDHFSWSDQDNGISDARRKAVVEAFMRSWASYKEHAWLHDELMPVSGGSRDLFGGWAATAVDCLDTLWIMGLKDEFYEAAASVVQLDWNRTTESSINVFETTIRHLGGLLSSYDLSGESALLFKARELGDMLYVAFDTPNRIPGFWLNFENAKTGSQVAGTNDPSAAPTSLSLEFTRLAQLTGDNKYFDAIDRVRTFLERTQNQSFGPGMWPAIIDFQHEDVQTDNQFTLGSLADSLYEYLLKMPILLGGIGVSPSYEKMYRQAMDAAVEHVLFRPMLPDGEDILFPGTTFLREDGVHLVPEGQHLACFAGGMFALGGKVFDIEEHVRIGERLTRGCIWAYESFPTGLMPEIFNVIECAQLQGCEWNEERWEQEGDQSLPKGFRNARDPRYLLRPEAIESIFILYRITGDEGLRDVAWDMFQSIVRATRTSYAYSAIRDVTTTDETEKEDSMESFWLSETLKYFYLIFSPPDVISLDDYVFSTEAHPFRRDP